MLLDDVYTGEYNFSFLFLTDRNSKARKEIKRIFTMWRHKSYAESYFFIFPSLPQHRDTQETLAVLERLDVDTEKPTEEELARKFGYEDAYVKGKVNWWQNLKPKLWSLMDEPYSSTAAKVKNYIFSFFSFLPREGKSSAKYFSFYLQFFFHQKKKKKLR